MANVAGVTQLMETIAPTTPASPSSPAPEHSFATAMQQASQDAGVPPAPAEQPEAAKLDDSKQKANETGEQASPPAPAANARPATSIPTKPHLTITPRYTSANMLSAILGAIIPAPSREDSVTSTVLPTAAPQSTPVATPDASATLIGQPVQTAASNATPVGLSTPVLPAAFVAAPPSKGAAKTADLPPHAPAPSTKQEAAKLADQAGTPLPAAAAPIVVIVPVATVALLPDTAVPVVLEETSALKTANVAGKSVGVPPPASTIPASADTVAQPGAATFQQSLTAQASLAAATLPQADPEAAAAARAVNGQLDSVNKPAPAHPDFISEVSSQQPRAALTSPDAPLSIVPAVTATVRPSTAPAAAAQVQAFVPQTEPQTSPVHKTSAKPALPLAAPQAASQATSASSQAAVQPAASASPVESKPATHLSSPAVEAPALATTPSTDASHAVPTPVFTAHTPLVVTATSNSTGPAFASTAVASTASISATTDALQHTTLSSTPTTLEVGVANGTHGWLKIRAELNASGTVDASLTGANAAASGRLHNDLPALSSFLQEERVAVGSLNVAAPGATISALHAGTVSALEPTSSFTRSAADGVGATGTAVASDAGASGGRAPQQQASESSPQAVVARKDDSVAGAITAVTPALYGQANERAGSGALSESGYGGGSWLNVRV